MGEITVVLASGSPRRAELLRRIGIEPVIRPADVDETPRRSEEVGALVARLARSKAEAVGCGPGELVIAADTVVAVDGHTLGKPVDDEEARRMLRALSGTTHHVLTGVHVVCDGRSAGAVEKTAVRFRVLSDEEIAAYLATGEPRDKAGGYGIQGVAGMFVESITGSDSNVIGLPLATVVRLAAEVGIRLLPR